ncbi:hypothetical protein AMS68_001291 [Peltaster fructicola]|uniref:ER membrane protein complex subunit 10 n=1 Tax=Peltaster fructicola TaxID=286661 RepID=A0A6H0XM21_9PEZI|nr:hypothetical protein AMS68_001291 [Peltaster fructicola]
MRQLSSLYLIIALLSSIVTAIETSKRVDVYAWPLSDQKAQLLAGIEYNSTTATIQSSHAPRISTNEKIVRVGFYQHGTGAWSGIATAAESFDLKKERVILLNLDSDAVVYHVGLRAFEKPQTQKGASQADLRAEVVPLHATPEVRLNKPIVLDATGQLEAPPEKTFLQKYWWAIGAFLLLQVFLSGGSDKKE